MSKAFFIVNFMQIAYEYKFFYQYIMVLFVYLVRGTFVNRVEVDMSYPSINPIPGRLFFS